MSITRVVICRNSNTFLYNLPPEWSNPLIVCVRECARKGKRGFQISAFGPNLGHMPKFEYTVWLKSVTNFTVGIYHLHQYKSNSDHLLYQVVPLDQSRFPHWSYLISTENISGTPLYFQKKTS